MSVDLHHGQRAAERVEQAPVDPGADRVLAAEHHHERAGARLIGHRRGDALHGASGIAGQLERRQRVDSVVERRFAVVLAVVQLDLLGGLDDRGRAGGGAAPVGDRELERGRQDPHGRTVAIAERLGQSQEVVGGRVDAAYTVWRPRLFPIARCTNLLKSPYHAGGACLAT